MSLDLSGTAELFRLLADASRMRLLALLAHEELTVAEITRVTGLTQSRVSTHLGRLKEAGVVRDRRDGSSSFHSMNENGMPAEVRRAWRLLRETARDALLDQDRERLAEVIEGRCGGQTWADSVAGKMDRHYSPGRTWEATAWGTLGLARLGNVLDVASGDGVVAELLAPRAVSVTCVDISPKVVAAGRRRLGHLPNVRFQQGDMHALSFADGQFQQALLMNALTYSEEPVQVIRELGRVLEPGGALVGATLLKHGHTLVTERYDHVRLGFEPAELRRMLEEAGFDVDLCEKTSRERRRPHFEVITIHARRRAGGDSERGSR